MPERVLTLNPAPEQPLSVTSTEVVQSPVKTPAAPASVAKTAAPVEEQPDADEVPAPEKYIWTRNIVVLLCVFLIALVVWGEAIMSKLREYFTSAAAALFLFVVPMCVYGAVLFVSIITLYGAQVAKTHLRKKVKHYVAKDAISSLVWLCVLVVTTVLYFALRLYWSYSVNWEKQYTTSTWWSTPSA